MSEPDDEHRGETGQRSHKGPAILSKLLRRRKGDRRRRERFRARIERTEE